MSDTNQDRSEGKVDEAMGRGKSALGDLTGDDQTKAEGERDQAKGQAKQGLADAKDTVNDAIDKVKNR